MEHAVRHHRSDNPGCNPGQQRPCVPVECRRYVPFHDSPTINTQQIDGAGSATEFKTFYLKFRKMAM